MPIFPSGSSGNSFETVKPQNGGTDGTSVVADSSTDTLTLNVDCGGTIEGNSTTDTLTLATYGMRQLVYEPTGVTDMYYGPQATSFGLQALTANRKYMLPVLIQKRKTITELAIVVTTLAAGTSARLGIRNRSKTNGDATTLVADFGTVTTASNGVQTATGSVTVDPGFYFLEIVSDGTASLRSIAGNAGFSMIGSQLTGTSANSPTGLYRSFTFGALPSDETGQTQTIFSSSFPSIWYR